MGSVMTNRPKPPPTTISSEAQAFIRDAVLPEPRPVDPSTIQSVRQAAHDYFAPLGASTAQACGVSVRQSELGGVRVEIVAPERFLPERSHCVVLYFFGGGHVVGSPDEDLMIIAKLAAFLGMTVYAPHYRLAPENPYPAGLNDAADVYSALLEKPEIEHIAVAGESAGGNLALASMLHARKERKPMPSAMALLSPWTDMTGAGESLTTHRGLDPTLSLDDNGNAEARAYAGGRNLRDPLISPLFEEDWTGFPPTVITTGTRDFLMSDSCRLARVMRRCGVDVQLNVWEGMWHVFEAYPDIPEAEESLEEVAGFIAAHLRTGAQKKSA